MTILGVDPGTAQMGYGLVDRSKEGKLSCVDFGCIKTPSDMTDADRLRIIKVKLSDIINKYKPSLAAVEKLFFTTNAKTAISVAQARGVVIEAISSFNIELMEFTPLQVKQAVTSYGKADKTQVQKMVQFLLNLPQPPKPDDAADALAVAICASNTWRK